MKICVYCSASSRIAPLYFDAGRAFGRMLAVRGHSLVYGGFNEGVMGAVADGTAEGGGRIVAVVPAIFDKRGFTHTACTEVVKTATMHERKRAMEEISDALVVLPGGIGTLDEFFEAFVLRTLGEMDKPIAILNVNGFYDLLRALLEQYVARGFLSEEGLRVVRFYDDADALLSALEEGMATETNSQEEKA